MASLATESEPSSLRDEDGELTDPNSTTAQEIWHAMGLGHAGHDEDHLCMTCQLRPELAASS